MKKAVGERSLAPEEFRGATITLSNFGTIAGRHAALIVITEQPMHSTDGLKFHRTLPLSLSFDHRAVSGGQAARFLRAAMIDLELAV